MACFDNSMYVRQRASPARTYHTYMSDSQRSYVSHLPDSGRLRHAKNYDYIWTHQPQNKPPHISKLRHILSETISSITTRDNLKPGESVELTLEIELMKTENQNPSNSLVEVTIVQHNKQDQTLSSQKVLADKMPLQLDSNSSDSVTVSQKRRNWFRRVIDRQNKLNGPVPLNKPTLKNYKHTEHSPILGVNRKQRMKNNFINILPEEILNFDYKTGYKRVSPNRKSPVQKTVNNQNSSKNDSVKLVKKLSEMFLPSKLFEKKTSIKPAQATTKNECAVEKSQTRKNKENTVKLKNLRKQMKDKPTEGEDSHKMQNKEKMVKQNTPQVVYQTFFEPIRSRRKANNNKIQTKLTHSHSETCCVHFKEENSVSNLRKSNSTCNCSNKKQTNQVHSFNNGDLKRSHTRTGNCASFDQLQKRNEKGDTFTNSTGTNGKKLKRRRRKKPSSNSQKSMIEWNGQKIQVNKEIKTRIEMIIVNELQNLALKEGMECDVTSLPPTETSSCSDKSVDKVSSFICELDLSDRKIKKLTKSKKSTEKKESEKQHICTKTRKSNTLKTRLGNSVERFDHGDPGMKGCIITAKDTYEAKIEEIHSKDDNGTKVNSVNFKQEIYQHGLEVTYINKQVENWSKESSDIKLKCGNEVDNNNCNIETQVNVIKFGEDIPDFKKQISSGFVKRIDSNDSTWKDFSKHKTVSGQVVSSTKSTVVISSKTSQASSIEIELNISDLESILKQAKTQQKVEKVIINARCKRDKKNQHKPNLKFSGKNSPSYTKGLLSKASKKLERYAKYK